MEENTQLRGLAATHSRILEQNQMLIEKQNLLMESNNALMKQVLDLNVSFYLILFTFIAQIHTK